MPSIVESLFRTPAELADVVLGSRLAADLPSTLTAEDLTFDLRVHVVSHRVRQVEVRLQTEDEELAKRVLALGKQQLPKHFAVKTPKKKTTTFLQLELKKPLPATVVLRHHVDRGDVDLHTVAFTKWLHDDAVLPVDESDLWLDLTRTCELLASKKFDAAKVRAIATQHFAKTPHHVTVEWTKVVGAALKEAGARAAKLVESLFRAVPWNDLERARGYFSGILALNLTREEIGGRDRATGLVRVGGPARCSVRRERAAGLSGARVRRCGSGRGARASTRFGGSRAGAVSRLEDFTPAVVQVADVDAR